MAAVMPERWVASRVFSTDVYGKKLLHGSGSESQLRGCIHKVAISNHQLLPDNIDGG